MIWKNKYGEVRSGWALLLMAMVVFGVQFGYSIFIGILSVIKAGASRNASDLDSIVAELMAIPWLNYMSQAMMIGMLLLLFWLLYKRPLSQMGLHTKGWLTQLLFGGLFGVLSIGLAVAILVFSGMAYLTHPDWSRLTNFKFYEALIHFIFVGFFEEILSRGFMMTALKTTRRKWLIVSLPAVMFGLLHLMNPNVTFFSLVNIMMVGLLFGYLFIQTGRLWAPIGYHITWNFFQGNVFGVAVSGTDRHFSLMDTVFTGPDRMTGGAFGIEGGMVCTIVILLGLLYVHFLVKKPEQGFWSMDGDMPLTRK